MVDPQDDTDWDDNMSGCAFAQVYHYFGAQCLPLNRNRVVCLNCGKVVQIGQWPTGKRAKCSRTRRYLYLGNGAVGHISGASGKLRVRSWGHAEYRVPQ